MTMYTKINGVTVEQRPATEVTVRIGKGQEMQIEITNPIDAKSISQTCNWVFKMLCVKDYPQNWEHLEEDANEMYQEIGEIIFGYVIGSDRMAELDAIRYPPEPEPEPLPELLEGQHLRYCRRCEKSTPHIKEDLIKARCVLCDKTVLTIRVVHNKIESQDVTKLPD